MLIIRVNEKRRKIGVMLFLILALIILDVLLIETKVVNNTASLDKRVNEYNKSKDVINNSFNSSVLWLHKTEGEIYFSPALVNIDGDGKLEAVVGTQDWNVYAFDFPSAGVHAYW